MGSKMNYADILTRVLREEEQFQPSFVPVKIAAVCDQFSGQFMLVAFGWEGQRHVGNILFHARLIDGHVVIETDMTEEGLKPQLIEAGIRPEDFLSYKELRQPEVARMAA